MLRSSLCILLFAIILHTSWPTIQPRLSSALLSSTHHFLTRSSINSSKTTTTSLKSSARAFATSATLLTDKAHIMTSSGAGPELIHRPSGSRGHAHHGWLRSFHTFSFASYYSEVPREQAWGSLRVINEDRVAPKQGFPTHSHREFEIFSLVLAGAIEHKDSMGNKEVLRRGDVQHTSAGTGIAHSEYNGGQGAEELHFLQCWAKPNKARLPPTYYTRHFTDEEKRDKLVALLAPATSQRHQVSSEREGSGPAPIFSDLTVYASILSPSSTVSHTFENGKAYLHFPMIKTGYRGAKDPVKPGGPTLSVKVGDKNVELVEGDGVYFDRVRGQEVTVKAGDGGDAEFVLFDIE